MNHEEMTAALAQQREAICRILDQLDGHRNGVEIDERSMYASLTMLGNGITTIADALELDARDGRKGEKS